MGACSAGASRNYFPAQMVSDQTCCMNGGVSTCSSSDAKAKRICCCTSSSSSGNSTDSDCPVDPMPAIAPLLDREVFDSLVGDVASLQASLSTMKGDYDEAL